MANPEHLERLKQSVIDWNNWRRENKDVFPNLSDANLLGADLEGINLSDANFEGANLFYANLSRANLSRINLEGANLEGANFKEEAKLEGANFKRANLKHADLSLAVLSKANLSDANLSDANLFGADLSYTDLSYADLSYANLFGANLSKADVSGAELGYTIFGHTDLSEVQGLETIHHLASSTIGIDSLYLSKGKIPDVFLRGCGVPEDLITYLPSIVGAAQAIQFYSCFISYSTQDEEFAKRLHARMREARLRVWFAPEDMKGGKTVFDQVDTAIQMHDRTLLVLSEHSMKSKWVFTEIRRSLKAEKKEGRRKLFPIRVVRFEMIQEWELFDSDLGEDLAKEIRSYFIPDFSNWKNHDNFEAAFDKLLRDLKAEEK